MSELMPIMKMPKTNTPLIEMDSFPFEFLSRIGERESWRKEVHRPVYHLHKWWAKRLGSVFRGVLLGCVIEDDLETVFYQRHSLDTKAVFDPFMGAGTTVGEAHKLGFTALGRDINPVAVESVRVAFGPIDRQKVESAFEDLRRTVGERIRRLYRAKDSRGNPCDVLYYFWVMQANCPACDRAVALFSSYVFARNAYPARRPEVQIVCPSCAAIFRTKHDQGAVSCPRCQQRFNPESGAVSGARATCQTCERTFSILDSLRKRRPAFRMYGKLVLTKDGEKQYLAVTEEDRIAYEQCSGLLREAVDKGEVVLPALALEEGHNTKQALNYGFVQWRDFFNDRQLLALGYLQRAIINLPDEPTRDCLLTLFSGVLEFNNLFASYKGEGTGAVRHMFSHHVLKPERTPIEANVWGTPKSSGSFSSLFRSRLLRAVDYRVSPGEVNGLKGKALVCSPPFAGVIEPFWPEDGTFKPRGIYLSCGDSSTSGLPDQSIDFVVTDPPFFDNVHYSELADFFFAWQQLASGQKHTTSTRSANEVQDSAPWRFAQKLQAVFRECHRILKDDGLLVFTYHHSREEGWAALTQAIIGAGFAVTNSHPVKSEMSVAAPKSQAKEPIQLDIVLVCRKRADGCKRASVSKAIESARAKIQRLSDTGFQLSLNDRKVILFGQVLTTVDRDEDFSRVSPYVTSELAACEIEHSPLFRAG